MKWIRAWVEQEGVGYRWFALGERDEGVSEEELHTLGRRPEMDLQDWAPDFHSAKITCTREQIRWFMDHGQAVNEYLIPDEAK